MAEITGYSTEDLLRIPYTDLIHPGDRSRVLKGVSDHLDGNSPGEIHFRSVDRRGQVIHLLGVFSPVQFNGSPALLGQLLNAGGQARAGEATREPEEKYRLILESIEDGFYEVDLAGNLLDSNEAMARIYGVDKKLFGINYREYMDSESAAAVFTAFNNVYKTGRPEKGIITQIFRQDGARRILEVSVSLIRDGRGQPSGFRGMVRDVTDRKLAEEKLRASEERFSKAFNASPVPMAIQEFPDWRYLDVNESFLRDSGFSRNELIGRTPMELGIYSDPEGFAKMGKIIGEQKKVRNLEINLRIKSGQVRTGLLSMEAVEVGGRRCLLTIFQDITDRKMFEEQLKYLSLHDSLTGLYNRAYFEEEMRRLEKGRSGRVGIIVCDVDGLKDVNDTRGHAAGDRLLVAAARVIRESFRGSDMISRIGGDEFAVLLPDCDQAALESACRRIRDAIARYNEANRDLPLSISVGFAAGRAPADLGELYKEADNNMYREKLHRTRSTRSVAVQVLLKALGKRDFITEGHADRMQELVAALARHIGLPDHRISDLRLFAQFHDIGKVGIPDRILFKPGPLSPMEAAEMRRHCEIGHLIAASPQELVPLADWILKHHEWWNGNGYPLGLKGEEIPLECRILAIADAFDAMTSFRPYRKAMTRREAVEELRRCAGTQFDPNLVPVFIEIIESGLTSG
ncbi:MAG: PAS domain S-box protein [Peptococcaceae bacterium]|nr:PAS domain S-box protein [Peptococcaceae bacterium]